MIASAEQYPLDTDRDLERRVANYLADRSVPALRRVAVEACEGHVTFRGRVSSFYEKQLMLNCYRAVPGVVSIVDHVAVD
jgi:osmotically-inducible protein OsmY